jgi:hypothetical protein
VPPSLLLDEQGLFKKGNPGGPGRPKIVGRAKYREVVELQCTLEVWAEIVKVAVKDALDGDRHARRWLGDYLVGAPATAPVPEQNEEGEGKKTIVFAAAESVAGKEPGPAAPADQPPDQAKPNLDG